MNLVVPKRTNPHSNIAFVRFLRRSNVEAAMRSLSLKRGASAKTLLFTVLNRTISDYKHLFDDCRPTDIHWSERYSDPNASNIVFEHGWLPRVTYQMSPLGTHARSHVMFDSSIDYYHELGSEQFERCTRRALGHLHPQQMENLPGINDKPFCLLTLGGTDFNLKYSESGFEYIYGQKNANELQAQALIDRIATENPGIRILITEHPAKKCRLKSPLSLPENNRLVAAQENIRSNDLASHPNCQGVIAINTNSIHEGMIKGTKACAYGRLMFRQEDKPVYSSVADMLNNTMSDYEIKTRHYLSMLFMSQWELTDFMDPEIVLQMLKAPEKVVPWKLRTSAQLTQML